MSKVFGITVTVGMCVAVAGALLFAINSAAALPDVYFSYKTNNCMKVVNYVEGHNYSCEHLPSKYHHVWVE